MVAGIFLIIATFIGVYRVSGDALAPDLKDGDLLFYLRFAPVEVGDVGIIDG
jgi:signal peptidase I